MANLSKAFSSLVVEHKNLVLEQSSRHDMLVRGENERFKELNTSVQAFAQIHALQIPSLLRHLVFSLSFRLVQGLTLLSGVYRWSNYSFKHIYRHNFQL